MTEQANALAVTAKQWAAIDQVAIPLGGKDGKVPVAGAGWQKLTTTPLDAFERKGVTGIGLILGRGFVDVDLDSVDPGDWQILPPGLPFGRGGEVRHIIYRYDGDARPTRKWKEPATGAMLIELRSTGAQTMMPPSLHRDTGTHVEWMPDGVASGHAIDPAAAPLVDLEELERAVDRLAQAIVARRAFARRLREFADRMRGTGEGARNDTLNRLAFELAGMPESDDGAICRELRDAAIAAGCSPAEVDATIASAISSGRARPLTGAAPTPRPLTGTPAGVPTTGRFALTDLGNAERLVARHGTDLRYCATWSKWLAWDGTRWAVDETGEVHRRAAETVRSIYEEASKADDMDRRKAVADHARRSESHRALESMVSRARTLDTVAIHHDELDANPWELNATNGVIDLRTGRLRPHDRNALAMKRASAAFDPSARAPTWERFLEQVQPDPAVRAFLQRLFGYALTGLVHDHVFPVFYGDGGNGKGTAIEAFMHAIGDYAKVLPSSVLLAKYGDSHPTELAILFKTRFASASETEANRPLAIAQVKALTGGDTISTRRMREDFWQFAPSHKIVLSTNHRPIIREDKKNAIWRRVLLVPWGVMIPREKADVRLPEKLRAELPGILAWAVRGCLEWQRIGLAAPSSIARATDAYREEMDGSADFFRECCVIDREARMPRAMLRTAYEGWADERGEKPISAKEFTTKVRELDVRELSSMKVPGVPNPVRGWQGLRLKTPAELEIEDAAGESVGTHSQSFPVNGLENSLGEKPGSAGYGGYRLPESSVANSTEVDSYEADERAAIGGGE